MSKLKVFISSTCYDLGPTRKKLHSFIESMGYDPVCSDHNEVMYDPKEHSHESCVKKVDECDFFVYIIGGRFGGEALPKVNALLKNRKEYKNEIISITQAECMRAIQKKIPKFVFIKNNVLKDHKKFLEAKGNYDTITFKSIEKQECAKYIFDFFDFLRKRETNNAYFSFRSVNEIKDVLKSQWSEYFQGLLVKGRVNAIEKKDFTKQKEIFLFNQLKSDYDNYSLFVEKYCKIYEYIKDFQSAPYDEWEDAAITFVDRAVSQIENLNKLKKDFVLKLPKDVEEELHGLLGCLNSYQYEIEEKKMNLRMPEGPDRTKVEFDIEFDAALEVADDLSKIMVSIKEKIKKHIEETLDEIKKL